MGKYKASNYNLSFIHEDKTIVYNSFTDNFIIIEHVLHELFLAATNENDLLGLKDIHEELFILFLNSGFIIPTTKDEYNEIKKISYLHDFNDENYELIINPTMNCNFKCWYCYETHIKDSKINDVNKDKIIKHIKYVLLDKKNTIKNFSLSWFGGEPLLYFDSIIKNILEYVHPLMIDNNISFNSSFTTNGLLISQDILNICKKFGVNQFQITLDGHRERHNEVRFISKQRGSYDKIIENIKLCIINNFLVIVRINISEETITDLLKIIDDFKHINSEKKNNLSFSFHEVWQEEKNLTTDISIIVEKFRENGLKSSYKGEQMATITNSCYADKLNQATINYNGDVFKCTARDFKPSLREGYLDDDGKIIWNENFQKRMFDSRFSNTSCQSCKILPLCNGGCSQHRLENLGIDYCIHNFDENEKLEIIKQKFYTRIANTIIV